MSNGRYWEELDLTEQFKSLWPIPYGGNQVYVTITLKSQCEKNKLPIKLYDLKSITKLKSRRKLYANQPVLCLYLNDDTIEKLVRNGGKHVHSNPSDEILSVPVDKRNVKRDASNSGCRKVDHTVSFKDLKISYIILPIEYNAGKCIGSCDNAYMNNLNKNETFRVNNYAKLLAAQAHVTETSDASVCCTPSEYDPLMLLIATTDGASIKQKLYHDMRVRDCYCR